MKATLTPEGAKRYGLESLSGCEVEIENLRTGRSGCRFADIAIDGVVQARSCQVSTPGFEHDAELILKDD